MRRARNLLRPALAAVPVAIVAILAIVAIVAGQRSLASSQPIAQDSPAADSSTAPVQTVRVDAIVTDARGVIASTLTSRDFELREDGNAVAIDEAQLVKNSPRLVAIYLD